MEDVEASSGQHIFNFHASNTGILHLWSWKPGVAPGEWTSSAGGKGPGTPAKARSGRLGAFIQLIFLGKYRKVWSHGIIWGWLPYKSGNLRSFATAATVTIWAILQNIWCMNYNKTRSNRQKDRKVIHHYFREILLFYFFGVSISYLIYLWFHLRGNCPETSAMQWWCHSLKLSPYEVLQLTLSPDVLP